MNASKELMLLCRYMIKSREVDFVRDYEAWKKRWHDFLNKRTTHKDGKTYYLHRRVRTLVHNTNNKIEGTFTDLKKNLNNHSGLTIDHRRQFIIAYFLMRQKVPTN